MTRAWTNSWTQPRVARWLPTSMVGALLLASLAAPAFGQAASNREDLVARLTGKRVHIDKNTGAVREISSDEARALIDAVVRATDGSAASAQAVVRSAAGAMLRLGDHVGHIVVARPSEDGVATLRCVGSADEAVAFLTEDALPLQ